MHSPKKTILHIVGDPVGGIRKHVHCVINHLFLKSWDVYYVYSNHLQDSAFVSEIAQMKLSLVSYLALSIRKKPHLTDLHNIVKIICFVRKHRIKIIHGHGAKGGMYARIAGAFTSARTFYTPHGGVAHDIYSNLMGKIYITVEKILRFFTDYYIFESYYTSRFFIKHLPHQRIKYIVNYNGVSLYSSCCSSQSPYSPVIPSFSKDRKNIGIFANLRLEKGQDIAIHALSKLIKSYPDILLHLFGDGQSRLELEKLTANLNLDQYVYFHGDVNEPYPYMLNMDAILIPSRFESFGYVAVESLMLKKPLISTRSGGLAEIVDSDVATVIPQADVDSVIQSIHDHFSSSSINELIRNGYEKYLKKFTLKNMLHNLQELYDGYL